MPCNDFTISIAETGLHSYMYAVLYLIGSVVCFVATLVYAVIKICVADIRRIIEEEEEKEKRRRRRTAKEH